MSNQLQQDHYKITPKEHETSKALPEEGGVEGAQYLQGRGAQINYKNRFLKDEKVKEHIEGIDDWEEKNVATQYLEQEVKTIVNKVESPDLSMIGLLPSQFLFIKVFLSTCGAFTLTMIFLSKSRPAL